MVDDVTRSCKWKTAACDLQASSGTPTLSSCSSSYTHTMAKRFSFKALISFFSGDDSALPEVFFEGSKDELGMEDEESEDGSECFGHAHFL